MAEAAMKPCRCPSCGAALNPHALPLAPPTEGEVDALAKVLIDYNGLPHDSIGRRIAMGKARAALAAFVAGRAGS